MATLFNPFFVSVDGSGNPRAAAKLYFYQEGTSTPANTWSDSALSVTNANPVVADSDGLFPAIYLDNSTAYKVILKDADDATITTRDPISSLTPASISAALGYTPANSGGSATSYLSSDVPLAVTSTYYDGPSTGSIGGSGQKWAIVGKGSVVDSAGSATFGFQLHDGTNVVDTAGASTAGANFGATVTMTKVVSLAGATTFTLKAANFSTSNGTLAASNDAGTTKFATSITAIRLS